MRPKVERLYVARELAEMAKVSTRTMQRRIQGWKRERRCDWVERVGNKDMVSLTRLRRAHPTMFAVQFATTEDLEEVVERVVRVEESCSDLRVRQNAMAAAIRGIKRAS